MQDKANEALAFRERRFSDQSPIFILSNKDENLMTEVTKNILTPDNLLRQRSTQRSLRRKNIEEKNEKSEKAYQGSIRTSMSYNEVEMNPIA